ncbi:hypothetical protein ACWT_5722 [Actinoplanes sp. SE50]|uniref:DUF6301 family protein n=1 Tax=unclassified Actinoplanes TaxID=2626549 RepID=UPI00023ED4B6|nr:MULTISPECIES: DUF6301 family protein [unclassified Actinoplanes]AEV86740.1 hypothetical protein ACPL_5853 [Actinoplanes sp. SE50/110]ATO85137.1 hypothetical protein ACWT_5722 [Actinoplanes sp. SE50]SLM02548.1 hypothetical protein ACSP50_5798 [Actinoplanes sp. SE50/110]
MTYRVIDGQALKDMLVVIRETDWDWSATATPGLLAQLGWDVIEELPGKGLEAETHLGVEPSTVVLGFVDGKVDTLMVSLTDLLPAQETALRQDAFAGCVSQATGILGAPTDRRPGVSPSASWRGPIATVEIRKVDSGVYLTWTHNAFADLVRSVEED